MEPVFSFITLPSTLLFFLFVFQTVPAGEGVTPIKGFHADVSSKYNETASFVGWSTEGQLFIGLVVRLNTSGTDTTTAAIYTAVSVNLTQYRCGSTKLFLENQHAFVECQQDTTGQRRVLSLQYSPASGEWSRPFVATVSAYGGDQRSPMNDGVSHVYAPANGEDAPTLNYFYARGPYLCYLSLGNVQESCSEFGSGRCKYIVSIVADHSNPDLFVVSCSPGADSEFVNFAAQYSAREHAEKLQLSVPLMRGQLYYLPTQAVLVRQNGIQIGVASISGISTTYGVAVPKGSVIVQSMLQDTTLLYTLRGSATHRYTSYRMDLSNPGRETFEQVQIAEGCIVLAFSIPNEWWLACPHELRHMSYSVRDNITTTVDVAAWPRDGGSFQIYVNYTDPVISDPPPTFPPTPGPTPPNACPTPSANRPASFPYDFDLNSGWCICAVVLATLLALCLVVGVVVGVACCLYRKKHSCSACSCNGPPAQRSTSASGDHELDYPLQKHSTKQEYKAKHLETLRGNQSISASNDVFNRPLSSDTTKAEYGSVRFPEGGLSSPLYITPHHNVNYQMQGTKKTNLFPPSFEPTAPQNSRTTAALAYGTSTRTMSSGSPEPNTTKTEPKHQDQEDILDLSPSILPLHLQQQQHVKEKEERECPTPILSATNSPTVSTREQDLHPEVTVSNNAPVYLQPSLSPPTQSEQGSPKLICASDPNPDATADEHLLGRTEFAPPPPHDMQQSEEMSSSKHNLPQYDGTAPTPKSVVDNSYNQTAFKIYNTYYISAPVNYREEKDDSSLGSKTSLQSRHDDDQESQTDGMLPTCRSSASLGSESQSEHPLDTSHDPSVRCVSHAAENLPTDSELDSISTRYRTTADTTHSVSDPTSSEHPTDSSEGDDLPLHLPITVQNSPTQGASTYCWPKISLSTNSLQSSPPVMTSPVSETDHTAATGTSYSSLDPRVRRPLNLCEGTSQPSQ